MKIVDIILSKGFTGYYLDDKHAIQKGATLDKNFYFGEPVTPGFKTIRLGLETAFFEERRSLDIKVGPSEFERASANLKEAGFTEDDLGAYLLFGLPGQSMKALEASIRIVRGAGIRPVLAQYSPIPHTVLWNEAVRASRYDLASDPIFHNNSIFPCQKEPFLWEKISYLKSLTQ